MAGATVAIVLAAGAGQRLGAGQPKAFVALGSRTILEIAAANAEACGEIVSLVVTVPTGTEEQARRILGSLTKPVAVVAGGVSRQESVRLALGSVPADTESVAVHDAARCLASPGLFSKVILAANLADGAIPILPVLDTVKRIMGGIAAATVPREDLALAQTPQVFRADSLRDVHVRAAEEGLSFTDDAAMFERAGLRVATVVGEETNFKITTPADVLRATAVLGGDVDG
jgi:2-C-methyl-D-erythritol 4-phosphate cytidylyltransferase/2-C-methyl-D-erythritol 2,4-cyclodiphosphate synthase